MILEEVRLLIRRDVDALNITKDHIMLAASFAHLAPEIWRKWSWLRALGSTNPASLDDDWRRWIRRDMLDDEPTVA